MFSDSELLTQPQLGTLTRSGYQRTNVLPAPPLGSPDLPHRVHGNTGRSRTQPIVNQPIRSVEVNTKMSDQLGLTQEVVESPLDNLQLGDMDTTLSYPTNDMDITFSDNIQPEHGLNQTTSHTNVDVGNAPLGHHHTGDMDTTHGSAVDANDTTFSAPLGDMDTTSHLPGLAHAGSASQHFQTSHLQGSHIPSPPGHFQPNADRRHKKATRIRPTPGDYDPNDPSSESSHPSNASNQSTRSFKDLLPSGQLPPHPRQQYQSSAHSTESFMERMLIMMQQHQEANLAAQQRLQQQQEANLTAQQTLQATLLARIDTTDQRLKDQAARTKELIEAAVNTQFQQYRVLLNAQLTHQPALPTTARSLAIGSSVLAAPVLSSDDETSNTGPARTATPSVPLHNSTSGNIDNNRNAGGIIAHGTNQITVHSPLIGQPTGLPNLPPTTSDRSSSSSSSLPSASVSGSSRSPSNISKQPTPAPDTADTAAFNQPTAATHQHKSYASVVATHTAAALGHPMAATQHTIPSLPHQLATVTVHGTGMQAGSTQPLAPRFSATLPLEATTIPIHPAKTVQLRTVLDQLRPTRQTDPPIPPASAPSSHQPLAWTPDPTDDQLSIWADRSLPIQTTDRPATDPDLISQSSSDYSVLHPAARIFGSHNAKTPSSATDQQSILLDSSNRDENDSTSIRSSQLTSDSQISSQTSGPTWDVSDYGLTSDDDDNLATGDIVINVNDPRLRGSTGRSRSRAIVIPTRDLSYFAPPIREELGRICDTLVDKGNYRVEDQKDDIYAMIPDTTEYSAWAQQFHFLKLSTKTRMNALHNYLTKMPPGSLYPPPALRIFLDPLLQSWLEVKPSRILGAGQGLFLRATNIHTHESCDTLPFIAFPYYGLTSNKDTFPGYSFKVRKDLYIIPDRLDRPLPSFINDDIHISTPAPRRTNMYFPATNCAECRSIDNTTLSAGAELTAYFGMTYSFLGLRFQLVKLLLTELDALLDNPARHDWKRWRDTEGWNSAAIGQLINHLQTIAQLGPILDTHLIKDIRVQLTALLARQKYLVHPPLTHTKIIEQFLVLWRVIRSEYKKPHEMQFQQQFPHMFLSQPRFISHFIIGLYGHPDYAQYDRKQFMKVFEQIFNGPRRGTLAKQQSFTNSPFNAWLRAEYAGKHNGLDKDFSNHWIIELGLTAQEDDSDEPMEDLRPQSMHPLATMRGKKPSVDRGTTNRVAFRSFLDLTTPDSPPRAASTVTTNSNSLGGDSIESSIESLLRDNPVLANLLDRLNAMDTTDTDLDKAISRWDTCRNHWTTLQRNEQNLLTTRFRTDPVYMILISKIRNTQDDATLDSTLTQFMARCSQTFALSSSSAAKTHPMDLYSEPTTLSQLPMESTNSSSSSSSTSQPATQYPRHRSPSPSEQRSEIHDLRSHSRSSLGSQLTARTAQQVELERDTDEALIADVKTAPYTVPDRRSRDYSKEKTDFDYAMSHRKDTNIYLYRGRPKADDNHPFPIEDFINHYYEIAQRSSTHPRQLINALLSPTAMYHSGFAHNYREWQNSHGDDPAFTVLPLDAPLSSYWSVYKSVCIFLCRREREIVSEHTVNTEMSNLRLTEPTGIALRKLWASIRTLARKLRKERQPDFYAVLETAIVNSSFPSNPEDITMTNIDNRYRTIIKENHDILVTEAIEQVVDQLEKKSHSRLAKIKVSQTANIRAPPAPTPSRGSRVNVAFTDQPVDLVAHAAPLVQPPMIQPGPSTPSMQYQSQPPNQQVNATTSFRPQQQQSTQQQQWTQVPHKEWNRTNNHNTQLAQQSFPNICFICGNQPVSDQHCSTNCPHRMPNVAMLDIAELARLALTDPTTARTILERALAVAKLSKVNEEKKRDIRNVFERWINEWRANIQPTPAVQQTQQVASAINRFARNGQQRPQSMQLISNALQLIDNPDIRESILAMQGSLWELNTEQTSWQSTIQKTAKPDLTNRNLVFIRMNFRAIQPSDTRFNETTKCLPVDQPTQASLSTAVAAMLDNGSSINLCTPEFVEEVGAVISWTPNIGILGVTGASCAGQVATFVIELEGKNIHDQPIKRETLVSALVIDMPSKLLLGGQFFAEHNVICYPDQRLASFFRASDRLFIQYVPALEMQRQLQEDQRKLRSNAATSNLFPNPIIQQIIDDEQSLDHLPDDSVTTQENESTIITQRPALDNYRVTCEDVESEDESELFIDSDARLATPAGRDTPDQHTPTSMTTLTPDDSPLRDPPLTTGPHHPQDETEFGATTSPDSTPELDTPEEYKALTMRTLTMDEHLPESEAIPTPNNQDTTADDREESTVTQDIIESQEFRKYIQEACTQLLPDLRPPLFPEDLWPLVSDSQKPLVKGRWNQYPEERILACIPIIYSIKVCEETPTRKEQAPLIRAFLFANIDAICFIDPLNPPTIPEFEADIILKPEATVYTSKSRPKQTMERASEDARCNWMITIGKMEPSISPWDHPTLLVPNRERISTFLSKHGANAMKALYDPTNQEEVISLFRLVMDFRELNRRTVLERFPLPRISDLLDKCTNRSNRYSGGDIADAYFCVLLREAVRPYTAFSTSTNHLQYRVMPQGLHSAPAMFARLIHKMFGDMTCPELLNYFDDIIVTAKSFGDHMVLWQQIMDTLRTHKLTLKPSKTSFNFYQQKVLGHVLCAQGRSLDPGRVEAIQNWRPPENQTELQSIIGTTVFAAPYVKNMSELTAPLRELNAKGTNVKEAWDDEIHGKTLTEIKKAITNAPVLLTPDPNLPFRIHVDACKTGRGLGAVLLQKDPTKVNADGSDIWGPCCYWSRILTPAERKLGSTELELTAMHDCIRHWYSYLYHTLEPFEVIVDCYALVYLVLKMNKSVHSNHRLTRYCLNLQDYYFSVTHRKGKDHIDADALSRLFQLDDMPEVNDQDTLRHDSGPLTEADIHQLYRRYDRDADIIIRTLRRHQEEQMDSLQSRVNCASIGATDKHTSVKTEAPTIMACTAVQCEFTGNLHVNRCHDCNDYYGTNTRITGHMQLLVGNRHNPIVRQDASAKALEKQLYKDVQWDLPNMQRLRLRLLKTIAANGICAHPLRLKQHDPITNAECHTGRCRCILNALRRHYHANRVCQQTIRSIQSRTLKEIMKNQYIIELNKESAHRITHELQRRIEVEHQRVIHEWATEDSTRKETATKPQQTQRDADKIKDGHSTLTTNPNRGDCDKTASRDGLSTIPSRARYDKSNSASTRPDLDGKSDTNDLNDIHISPKSTNLVTTEAGNNHSPSRTSSDNMDDQLTRDKSVSSSMYLYTDKDENQGCSTIIAGKPEIDGIVDHNLSISPTNLCTDTNSLDSSGNSSTSSKKLSTSRATLPGIHKTRAIRRQHLMGRMEYIDKQYWSKHPPILAYSGITHQASLITNAGIIGATTQPYNTTHKPNSAPNITTITTAAVSFETRPDIAEVTIPGTRTVADRMTTRQTTGHSRPSAIAQEHIQDKVIRSAQQTEREIERNDQLIGEYNYLHGLTYSIKENGFEYQVIDTFVASRSKETGRVFKSIAWPTNAVTCADQRNPANWDIRNCNGPNGTIELVKQYQSQSDLHWMTAMPTNATEWLEHQTKDDDLKQQIERCDHPTTRLYLNKSQPTDQHPRFLYRTPLTNGQLGPLMRRFSTTEEIQHGNIQHTTVRTYDQFVVPKHMRRTVLYHLHDQMGHPGSQRCLASIRNKYWWPAMSAEVKLYTHQCRFCEIRKANNIRPKVPIQSYRTPLHPFHLTHIDLTGPLSKSHGYEYLLVCKDALTKYTIIRKLPNKSMTTVIPALVDIFNEYGAPRELVSDRGTEFTNISLKNVCRLLQVHKIFCTPGNPRSNGLAKNAMRTLKDMLAYYVDKTQTNWSTYVSVIQHIYNTTINLSTGYTPFYLLFGRECPSPDEDQLKKPLRDLPEFKDLKLDDYVKGLRDSLALAWDALGSTFWTDKTEIYNSVPKKRLPFKEYKVDQLAYIKRIPKRFYKDPVDELNYHLSSKLQERFSGPYRITAQLSPVLYKAMIHGTERVIHAINMKPARIQLDVVDEQFTDDDDTWQQIQQFNQLDYDQLRAHYCHIVETQSN